MAGPVSDNGNEVLRKAAEIITEGVAYRLKTSGILKNNDGDEVTFSDGDDDKILLDTNAIRNESEIIDFKRIIVLLDNIRTELKTANIHLSNISDLDLKNEGNG